MKYYLSAFKHFTDFSGRASRREYWMFALFNFLFAITAIQLDAIWGTAPYGSLYGFIYSAYILITFIPALAVATRRLHDSGRSGWYNLLAFLPVLGWIILIVLLAADSEHRKNAYGPEPAEQTAEQQDERVGDRLLLGLVLWTFFMGLGFKLLYTCFQEYALDFVAQRVWQSISIVGLYYSLIMATVIKDRQIRQIAFILAVLFIIFMISFDGVKSFVERIDLFM